MTTTQNTPSPKKKGIFRWEAIIPFTIFCALVAIYFHLFFDSHLRKAMEWGGYKAMGAEVNVAKVETSFFNASLLIKGIEITNAEKPTHNSLEIGDIRFSMLWDALLRAKIVINEAAVEQIKFNTKRKHIGKVKPPEPPSNEPGFIDELSQKALGKVSEKGENNVLGDAIALLTGTDANAQLDKLKNSLPSKAMIESFEKDLKGKEKAWDARLKTLPQEKDLKALNDRLNKIKYKDFKTPQELQTSIQELDTLVKDGERMYKQVESTANDLGSELKGIESQYKQIESQVKTDIKSLEEHFRIPKLDAKSISQSLFADYLNPYKEKFFRYKAMAEKYIPPNLLKKKEAKEDEIVIQPHPREEGISYEFGRLNSYPLYWVKRTGISSQAGTDPNAGDIKGEIRDITSNQKLIGRPTIATLEGDFPNMDIFGFFTKVVLDYTKAISEVQYDVSVAKYKLNAAELVATPEVNIAFDQAQGAIHLKGFMKGFKEMSIQLENKFSNIAYKISSNNEIADEILKKVFEGIPLVTLDIKGAGTFPRLPLSINSNLGPELQKGFEKQIQAKINETRKKIELAVNEEIAKQKAMIDSQIKSLRQQFEGDVKKTQAQVEGQRKEAEKRIDQAKKDAENQGKKQLEKEGQKAVDELKKRLGL